MVSEDGIGLNQITAILNLIYRAGNTLSNWLKFTFVTFPKTYKALQCDDCQIISLISQILKKKLRIIPTYVDISKIRKRVVDLSQFGYRNGMETREHFYLLNVLT